MTTPFRTIIVERQPELASLRIRFQLLDEDDAAVERVSLASLMMRVFCKENNQDVTGRDEVDVLSSLHATSGQFELITPTTDLEFLRGDNATQTTVFRFDAIWAAGERRRAHDIEVTVENLSSYPTA